jgi:hypothetical protein
MRRMSVMNIEFFEALGFEIGQALAASLPHSHPPAAEGAPRGATRRGGRKGPAARGGKSPFNVGDHVFYKQGRGTFAGTVVRVSADGRCVVMRDTDGKRVLRPPTKLKRA